MPHRLGHNETMYLDEAEGFILEHALFSPPRTWPPLPPAPPQATRLAASKKKMDWEGAVRDAPDEPIDLPPRKDTDEEANKERCVICLMALRDRTIVGVCGHEFCFECIGVWSNQSRRCPLCSADMAPFLLHDLDSSTPTKFYLPPLPQRRVPTLSLPGPSRPRLPEERRREEAMQKEVDELDVQVERRREIYQHGLFVKHIGTNPATKFRPNPTPRQISEDAGLVQRATTFMRQFLTNYILSLLKAIDIRSEPAVRLLAEFLDTPDGPGYPNGAEHFAHEMYAFLRSPFKELRKYDEIAQYDSIPSDRSPSPGPSVRSRSVSRSPSRSLDPLSLSRSPSPRRSRSRSRSSSFSRPRSPRIPRDPRRRDTFIAPASPSARKWNEADTWVDPDYATWLEEEKKRHEERLAQRSGRRRISQPEPAKRVELLPSPPPPPLRMEVETNGSSQEDKEGSNLTIRGTAKAPSSRLTLLERLAKAKAEAANGVALGSTDTTAAVQVHVQAVPDPTTESQTAMSKPGVRAAVQARLRLRLKLASEKKAFVYNQNESRAQALRAKILEAKARREVNETDAVLRHMDRIDRAREVRRRLMVLKILAAETESERRARELKEKLMGEKRARELKEQLRGRKKGQSGVVADGVVSAISVR